MRRLAAIDFAALGSAITLLVAFAIAGQQADTILWTLLGHTLEVLGAAAILSFVFLALRDHHKRGFFRSRPLLTAFHILLLPISTFAYYLFIYLPSADAGDTNAL